MDLQGTRFRRATEAVVQSDCAREAWQGFTADSNAIFEGCLDSCKRILFILVVNIMLNVFMLFMNILVKT